MINKDGTLGSRWTTQRVWWNVECCDSNKSRVESNTKTWTRRTMKCFRLYYAVRVDRQSEPHTLHTGLSCSSRMTEKRMSSSVSHRLLFVSAQITTHTLNKSSGHDQTQRHTSRSLLKWFKIINLIWGTLSTVCTHTHLRSWILTSLSFHSDFNPYNPLSILHRACSSHTSTFPTYSKRPKDHI